MVGHLGKLQTLLQFLHQASLFLLRIQFFSLFQTVKLVLFAVHLREVEQVALVAPLGYGEGDIGELPVHLKRHDYLFGLAAKALPDFGYGIVEQLLVRLVEHALVLEGETLVHGAILDVHVVDKSQLVALAGGNGKHVYIGDGMAHHLALAYKICQQEVLLLQLFGFFKTQCLCKLLHPCKEQFAERARVALQYLLGLSDALLILLVRLFADTWRTAVMDVVL